VNLTGLGGALILIGVLLIIVGMVTGR